MDHPDDRPPRVIFTPRDAAPPGPPDRARTIQRLLSSDIRFSSYGEARFIETAARMLKAGTGRRGEDLAADFAALAALIKHQGRWNLLEIPGETSPEFDLTFFSELGETRAQYRAPSIAAAVAEARKNGHLKETRP